MPRRKKKQNCPYRIKVDIRKLAKYIRDNQLTLEHITDLLNAFTQAYAKILPGNEYSMFTTLPDPTTYFTHGQLNELCQNFVFHHREYDPDAIRLMYGKLSHEYLWLPEDNPHFTEAQILRLRTFCNTNSTRYAELTVQLEELANESVYTGEEH